MLGCQTPLVFGRGVVSRLCIHYVEATRTNGAKSFESRKKFLKL